MILILTRKTHPYKKIYFPLSKKLDCSLLYGVSKIPPTAGTSKVIALWELILCGLKKFN